MTAVTVNYLIWKSGFPHPKLESVCICVMRVEESGTSFFIHLNVGYVIINIILSASIPRTQRCKSQLRYLLCDLTLSVVSFSLYLLPKQMFLYKCYSRLWSWTACQSSRTLCYFPAPVKSVSMLRWGLAIYWQERLIHRARNPLVSWTDGRLAGGRGG